MTRARTRESTGARPRLTGTPSKEPPLTATDAPANSALAAVAPGTELRAGLDRIVRGGTGALIVLGDGPDVIALCTGGFLIDAPLTATSLRELAKMDGALVVTSDLRRVVRAAVQLMPDAAVTTHEAGTRHRTAERVSRQTGAPVVTVSASMATIALFLDGQRHVVLAPEQLLARAQQTLDALTRSCQRLTEAGGRLSALEVQDQVTVGDVALVAQRWSVAASLRAEVARLITELGVEGRLLNLQLQDLTPGWRGGLTELCRDYATSPQRGVATDDLHDGVADLSRIAVALGLPTDLDAHLSPRGHRQLAQITALPVPVADRLIDRFGSLQLLFAATPAELAVVDGMTPALTRTVREGLVRLAEAAYAEPMS